MTSVALANGVNETYGYSADRLQLTSQTATKGSTLMSLTYSYSGLGGTFGTGTTAGNTGQLVSITGTINNQSRDQGFTYDNVGRLLSATGWSAWTRRFAFDRWGNRTGMWDALSGGNQLQNIAIATTGGVANNRIADVNSVSYTYDASGNCTWDGGHSYAYDGEGRQANVDNGATATNVYNSNNWRLKKVSGGTTTHYVWEGSQVIAEYNGSTGALISEYVYAGSRMVARDQSGVLRYFHQDRLSTRVITDGSGALMGTEDHLPFGEEAGTTGETEKHRFTNYERDTESNTDYAINRQNQNAVGRFVQPDPVAGNPANPQSVNRYSYTANDPINFTDPQGLFLAGPGSQQEPIYLDPSQCYTLVVDGIAFGTIGNCGGGSQGGGIGPGDGGGGGPQNSDKNIAYAVDRARAVLSTKNPCSDYFGANAIKALNTFEKILTRGYPNGPGDTQLGIRQSGQQTTYEQPTQYRTFQNAVINNAGPFFNLLSKTRLGGYNPGSNQSQVLQILHELAHLVYNGGAPLIPDDSGTTKKVDSEANTREVLKHCKSEIDKIRN